MNYHIFNLLCIYGRKRAKMHGDISRMEWSQQKLKQKTQVNMLCCCKAQKYLIKEIKKQGKNSLRNAPINSLLVQCVIMNQEGLKWKKRNMLKLSCFLKKAKNAYQQITTLFPYFLNNYSKATAIKHKLCLANPGKPQGL